MSDATAATNTGAPAPPPPQPTAATSQASTAVGQTSDAGAQQRMRNAIAFLNNAQVRASPLVRRVNFLKSKGMSAEEIVDAFSRANQPQSLETIKDIISGKIAAPAPPPPPAAAPVASPGSTAPPAAAPVAAAPPAPPAYPYPPYPYPYPPPPPPPNAPPPTAAKPAEGLTWKDYFIGATVGAAGLYAATKAFVAFSPYDIVRKDEWAAKRLEAPAPVVPAVRQSLPTLPTSGNGLAPSASFVFDRQATASLAPAQPTPPAVDTSAKDAEIESLKGQLDESQKQVTELKAEGDKLRREKADLAVNVGKLKGQIAALQRQIERSELTVESKIQERLAEQRRLLAPDPIVEALNGESGGSAAAAVPTPAEPAAAPPAASEAEAGSA